MNINTDNEYIIGQVLQQIADGINAIHNKYPLVSFHPDNRPIDVCPEITYKRLGDSKEFTLKIVPKDKEKAEVSSNIFGMPSIELDIAKGRTAELDEFLLLVTKTVMKNAW